MASFKFEGIDELLADFDKIQNKIDDLSGEVPVSKILTPEFLQANSKFKDLDGLIKASGFTAEELFGLEEVPEKLDSFIASNTDFDSWSEFYGAAGEEYFARNLDI